MPETTARLSWPPFPPDSRAEEAPAACLRSLIIVTFNLAAAKTRVPSEALRTERRGWSLLLSPRRGQDADTSPLGS